MMRLSILLAAGLALAAPAGATTLFEAPATSGPILSPGAVAVDFTGKGTGRVDFRLLGFASLDGDGNGYTDVFTLSLNGTDIFSGSFDLGGGGNNIAYFGPAGSRFAASTPGMWQGGSADISVPLALATGANQLSFRYDGNAQGGGDEAWGLEGIRISGVSIGAVPEPASWALLIIGFGLVGATLRSRRLAPQSTQSSPTSR